MSKKEDIQRIWKESFADSREYVKMFFDRVYTDREAMTLEDMDGHTVSSLLLRDYEMAFHGSIVPVGYICGAATRRRERGKGYMSELMRRALRESADRGHMMLSLIPARDALYYFYRRFGFSTVFYTKEQRFTSLHSFPVAGAYHAIEAADTPEVRQAFGSLQELRRCYIRHSDADFANILADLGMDGGDFVVMASPAPEQPSGHTITSMAWAVKRDDMLLVNDVMGRDADARQAALRQLRSLHPDTPFLLYGRPGDPTGGRLMPRGMGRVVNARLLLEAVAAANVDYRAAIRVTDRMLPDVNSHTFIIHGGEVDIDDSWNRRLDLDIPIDVLADIAFSSPAAGAIVGFPSSRPMISLMLD